LSRVLAVDPGDARIGLALSDELRVIARPLNVLEHRSRAGDVDAILEAARQHGAGLILVGVPYDRAGQAGPQARKALRLIEALRLEGDFEVRGWDETGSTEHAQELGGGQGALDARAAAVILQEFLDAALD